MKRKQKQPATAKRIQLVQARQDGRFEAKGVDPDTGQRKSYYSRSSLAEAKELAARSLVAWEARLRGERDRDTSTLYAYYRNLYLPIVAGRSENWKEQIGWAMDRLVLPAFGEAAMGEIKRTDWQLLFNSLGRKLKKTTCSKVKIVISGIYNAAIEDEVVGLNPVRKVRITGLSSEPKVALSPAQLRALLQAAGDRIRPYILFGGFCGLRPGESLGVCWGDIQHGTLRVRRQVLQPSGGCIVSSKLKTDSSRRDIPLPESLIAALEADFERRSIYVCASSTGSFLTPNNAHRDLEAAIQRAGIPRVTPHELRHTFISIMENDPRIRAPRAIIAALTGKKDASQLGTYSHPSPDQMRPWMETFWEVVTGQVEDLPLLQLSTI